MPVYITRVFCNDSKVNKKIELKTTGKKKMPLYIYIYLYIAIFFCSDGKVNMKIELNTKEP